MSVVTLVAQDWLAMDFKIKYWMWPLVIILTVAKTIMTEKTQFEVDLRSLLDTLKFQDKLIKLLQFQQEFHGLAVIRITQGSDLDILRITDNVLHIVHLPTLHETTACLRESGLFQKIKASCKVVPAEMGQKLFKFSHKLNRDDRRIQTSVAGFSFGDSEVLVEITPKKEVQISIEADSPDKIPNKIISFSKVSDSDSDDTSLKKRSSSALDLSSNISPPGSDESEKPSYAQDSPDSFAVVAINLSRQAQKNSPVARKSSLKVFRRYDSLQNRTSVSSNSL